MEELVCRPPNETTDITQDTPEKSPMLIWAEHEIELACKREKECPADEGSSLDFEYGCGCYGSAFKAFKSLLGDGHSGMSISITKNILNRLIDGKPLTPINDEPDEWRDCTCYGFDENEKTYQSKRMPSLFKDVSKDGIVKYSDIDAWRCKNINSDSLYTTGGLVREIVDELCPVTFPYFPPSGQTIIITEELLTDANNGDFDTRAYLYAIKPDGSRVDVSRYEKITDEGWEEIDESEFNIRKLLHNNRLSKI